MRSNSICLSPASIIGHNSWFCATYYSFFIHLSSVSQTITSSWTNGKIYITGNGDGNIHKYVKSHSARSWMGKKGRKMSDCGLSPSYGDAETGTLINTHMGTRARTHTQILAGTKGPANICFVHIYCILQTWQNTKTHMYVYVRPYDWLYVITCTVYTHPSVQVSYFFPFSIFFSMSKWIVFARTREKHRFNWIFATLSPFCTPSNAVSYAPLYKHNISFIHRPS